MAACRKIFRTSPIAIALNLLVLTHVSAQTDEFETSITVPSMTTALIQHAEIAAR